MKKNFLNPFLFENTPIRGNLVYLGHTIKDALEHQKLPLIIKKALGELIAASTLLTSTLKMNGAMVLQIQNKGQLKLLVVECNSDLTIRATAKWDGEIADDANFIDLIKEGHCVITLDPKNSNPYQGIVPMEGNSIAEILENYMIRSQQIDTKLWLNCDGEKATGMLLQKLPEQPSQDADADAWNRIGLLADTVTDEEMQNTSIKNLINKLFNEEDVRLFEAKPIRFYCKCNQSGVANMLQMLGKEEVETMLEEQTVIEVNCDFCNLQYQFDAVDIAAIFSNKTPHKASKAVH